MSQVIEQEIIKPVEFTGIYVPFIIRIVGRTLVVKTITQMPFGWPILDHLFHRILIVVFIVGSPHRMIISVTIVKCIVMGPSKRTKVQICLRFFNGIVTSSFSFGVIDGSSQ